MSWNSLYVANFSDGRTANKRPVSGSMVCGGCCWALGTGGWERKRSARRLQRAQDEGHTFVRSSLTACCCSVLEACAAAIAPLGLPADANERAQGYVSELLRYNERTNAYSKSAIDKLPLRRADLVTLALEIQQRNPRGVLDLGSGSGLPSIIIARANPDIPRQLYAIESKSRKTRLAHAAKQIGLEQYTPLTQNVFELSSWYFDVDVVTAKAFKPLPEVGPIGERCILHDARLLVPISEAQVGEFALGERNWERRGDGFIYYSRRSRRAEAARRGSW